MLLCSWNSPGKNTGMGIHSPSDLHNPGIKPGFPELQANSLPSEPPGKPSKKHMFDINSYKSYLKNEKESYIHQEITPKSSKCRIQCCTKPSARCQHNVQNFEKVQVDIYILMLNSENPHIHINNKIYIHFFSSGKKKTNFS